MRNFSKVSPLIWESDRFGALDNAAKLLLLYYLTTSHGNSVGCFRIPDAYACADLRWQPEEYEASRQALVHAGSVRFDPSTREILIVGWFKFNRPHDNPKYLTGSIKVAEKIRSTEFRCAVMDELKSTEVSAHPLNSTPHMLRASRLRSES